MLFGILQGCSAYDSHLLRHSATAAHTSDAGSSIIDAAALADAGGKSDAGCDPRGDDPANCGSCGHRCSVVNGEAACTRGVCGISYCHAGFADCDHDAAACETPTTTPSDCGGCNAACRELAHAVAKCVSGSCEVGRCEAGYADCDKRAQNGCETVLGTLADCSGCGVPCDKASCAGGVCTSLSCPPGFGDCDGDQVACETDLHSDVDNCGQCGVKCELPSGVTAHGALDCTAQGCAIRCDPGYFDCDGDYRTGCEPGTDSDGDGAPDCVDGCDSDPKKQSPGACGCGNPDTDRDEDGIPDCSDGCPVDPTRSGPCLGFAPSNFDPSLFDWSSQPRATLDCGTTTLDTTDPDGDGPAVATLTNFCGAAPSLVAQAQNGGPELVLLPLRGLSLPAGNTLRVIGIRPLVLAVAGDVAIDGIIDASASATTPGAGGNAACGTSQGGNGSGSTKRFSGASGGGGGGFGTAGGRAGTADTDGHHVPGGAAGAVRGNPALEPLLGGCAGGQAGGCSSAGAAGGGALQITAAGNLVVHGKLLANGGAGATPCGSQDEGGGTGGGSGGALLLEALSLDTASATLQVNGGNGGANGQFAGIYNCGGKAGGAGSTSASNAGSNGSDCQGGSSGGGGGYGRVYSATR